MLKIAISGVLLLSASGGCEHTAAVQQPHPVPDPQAVHSVTGLRPAELALLLEQAGAVEASASVTEPWCPQMEHPLDGAAPEQVRALFTAAGLPAERYLRGGRPAAEACTRPGGAR